MIHFNEIKIGDFLCAEYNATFWEGEVVDLNRDEKQICVATEVQTFWFEPEDLYPIPLNDAALMHLNFTKQDEPDGGVKYAKGAFRLVTPHSGDFSQLEMWYREDKRHNPHIHFVHQLQNQYTNMTKVLLTKDVI